MKKQFLLLASASLLALSASAQMHDQDRDRDHNHRPPPLYDEPYRPQYHFSPPMHFMNDPNGQVYFNGIFHLYYQYTRFSWLPVTNPGVTPRVPI
jgi:sucrose-6-phosphate hydrolase SacC (GH32 family)